MHARGGCTGALLRALCSQAGRGAGKRGGGAAAKPKPKRGAAGGAGGAGKEMRAEEASCLRVMQRDQGLELFHALGKVLYNKRNVPAAGEEEEQHDGGQEGVEEDEEFGGMQGAARGGRGRGGRGRGGRGGAASQGGGGRSKETAAERAAAKVAAPEGGFGALRGLPSMAYSEQQLLPR